jgi:hypothetical protein
MKNMMPMEHEMEDENGAKGYEDYELKEACETLLKAEMIKKDEKMMKALEPILKKKAEAAAALVSKEMKKPKDIKEMRMMINKKAME